MIKYDREEWLESLKEGDIVALESGSWGYKHFNLQKIAKITPTRRFNLESGRKFDSSGFLMGHKDQWTSRPAIRPYDQYVKEHLEREGLLLTISKMKAKDLHLDQLRDIVKILEETAD